MLGESLPGSHEPICSNRPVYTRLILNIILCFRIRRKVCTTLWLNFGDLSKKLKSFIPPTYNTQMYRLGIPHLPTCTVWEYRNGDVYYLNRTSIRTLPQHTKYRSISRSKSHLNSQRTYKFRLLIWRWYQGRLQTAHEPWFQSMMENLLN